MSLRTRSASFWVLAFGICAAIAIGLGFVRTAESTRAESATAAAAQPVACR